MSGKSNKGKNVCDEKVPAWKIKDVMLLFAFLLFMVVVPSYFVAGAQQALKEAAGLLLFMLGAFLGTLIAGHALEGKRGRSFAMIVSSFIGGGLLWVMVWMMAKFIGFLAA